MTWLEKQWVALFDRYAHPPSGYGVTGYKRFRDETRLVRLWHDLKDRLERIFLVRLACIIIPLLALFGIAYIALSKIIPWLAKAWEALSAAGLL